MGHPMPHSLFLLHPKSNLIEAQLKIPIKELQLAFQYDLTSNPDDSIQRFQSEISAYIQSHLHIISDSKNWVVHINDISVSKDEQIATGEYYELVVNLNLIPPTENNLNQFTLRYDGVVHQVVTHKIFVNLTKDWKSGELSPTEMTLGIIELDIANNTVKPLDISLVQNSWWTGFKTMVKLGMHHIAEGIDHLLFLLILLLTAPLIEKKRDWQNLRNPSQGLKNILKITLAFTIGHSISLILATYNLVSLPSQPVEVIIAISILITAIHAIKPIFAGREIYVAVGFGLIHGLAFATLLQEFTLDQESLATSLLGFNVGIELMQILIILLVIPWLLFLSGYRIYRFVRISISIFALLASVIWAIERVTLKKTEFSSVLDAMSQHAILLVPLLMLLSLATYFFGTKVFSQKSQEVL